MRQTAAYTHRYLYYPHPHPLESVLSPHQDDEDCLEGSILSVSIGGNAEFNYNDKSRHAFGTCITLSDLDCILAKGSWWRENWHSVKNGGEERYNLTFRRIKT